MRALNLSRGVKFLAGLSIAAAIASAQIGYTQPPDCQANFALTATGTAAQMPNYFGPPRACTVWKFAYAVASTGTVTSLSIRVESAPAGTTQALPGTFIAYNGTVVQGAVTNTSITGAEALLSDGAIAVPWIQVDLTAISATGTTVVFGTLQGWNAGNASGVLAAASSGCPNPCPVIGTAAAGTAPSGAPVQVGGWDGTNIRTIREDTTGRQEPAFVTGALADATTNSPQIDAASGSTLAKLVYSLRFNGATWDRAFYCSKQAAISASGVTDVLIVTGVAATKTHVCHLDFVATTSVTMTIQEGTGATCGVGTVANTGAYPAIVTFAQDYTPGGPLVTQTTADNLCLHFGGSTTGGGFVTYDTF